MTSAGMNVTCSMPVSRVRVPRDLALGPAQRRTHQVDHDSWFDLHDVGQVVQGTNEPREPDRVGPAHDEHGVGRRQHVPRHLVAARAASAFARLERRGAVGHEDVGIGPQPSQHQLERARTHLRPHVGARDAAEQAQPRLDVEEVVGDLVGPSLVGGAAGRHQAAHVVEHREHLGDGAAVGVGVDEHGVAAVVREGRRE